MLSKGHTAQGKTVIQPNNERDFDVSTAAKLYEATHNAQKEKQNAEIAGLNKYRLWTYDTS